MSSYHHYIPMPFCILAGVWEGQFFVPGVGAFLLTADALAGSGDVAALLGDREVGSGHWPRLYCDLLRCLRVHLGSPNPYPATARVYI